MGCSFKKDAKDFHENYILDIMYMNRYRQLVTRLDIGLVMSSKIFTRLDFCDIYDFSYVTG